MYFKGSYYCFTYGRNGFYKFLTIIVGMPLAFVWGILFALFSFMMIWFCTPSLQLFKILLQSIRSFYSVVIQTLLTPLYEAASAIFSRINVTINYSSRATNNSNSAARLYPVLDNNDKKFVV